jgi:DNA primase
MIVEGYFDLISLFQVGIKNVVASSGTAFTLTQARLLSHFADSAYLFFDSDSAGQMAALRSVDALYDAGLEVMVMSAPEGEDPDSLAVKGGREAIERVHDQAVSFIEYRTRRADLDSAGIIAKEKLIKEFAALFRKVGDTTRRDVMILDAAERMKIPPRQFYDIMSEKPSDSAGQKAVQPPRKLGENERDLLSLMICYPEEIARVMEKLTPDDFHVGAHRAIYECIIAAFKDLKNFTEAGLISKIEDQAMLIDITALAAVDWSGYNVSSTVRGLVKKIQDLKRERIIDTLKVQLKEAEDRGESKEAERLQNEIMDLIKRREQ